MSSKILDIYVKPASAEKRDSLLQHLHALKEERFEDVRELDKDQHLRCLDDLGHYFVGSDIEWKVNDGIAAIRIESFPSLEEEALAAFLYAAAQGCLEGCAYHTGVGEYSFFDHKTIYDEYEERSWEILQKPLQLEEQVVVFTGSMNYGTREEIEELAQECDCEVQRSVTQRTMLLVRGEKPGASKVRKAAELGVRIITEVEFLVAADEY